MLGFAYAFQFLNFLNKQKLGKCPLATYERAVVVESFQLGSEVLVLLKEIFFQAFLNYLVCDVCLGDFLGF